MPLLRWLMQRQATNMGPAMPGQQMLPPPFERNQTGVPMGSPTNQPQAAAPPPSLSPPPAAGQPQGLLGGGLSPGMGALLALSAGLLSNRDKRLGEGLGAGLMNAVQTYSGLEGQQRVRDRLAKQDEKEQAAADQQAKQSAAVENWVAQQPAEQQAILRANPEAASKAMLEQMFKPPEAAKAPTSRTVQMGTQKVTQEWDPTANGGAGGWNEIARGAEPTAAAPKQPLQLVKIMTPDGPRLVPENEAIGKVPYESTSEGFEVTLADGTKVTMGGKGGGEVTDKPLPADMAGRVAGVSGSRKQLNEIEPFYFPGGELDPSSKRVEGGNFNRLGAAQVNPPIPSAIPFTEDLTLGGGAQRTQINGMIDSIIRLRTGAGLNVYEPAYYRNMFMPSSLDSEATAREKLRQLRIALEEAGDAFNKGRKEPVAPGSDAPAAAAPAIGTVQDGYRFKGGDPADPNSWEPAG